MAYIDDKDLQFLQNCHNDDLDVLVKYLTMDKDGNKRVTQGLTVKSAYKKNFPDHQKYWEEIAGELQLYGGNTIANFFRSDKGVTYRIIIEDICKRFKIKVSDEKSTAQLEEEILKIIINRSIDKMSQDELQELVTALGITDGNITKESIKEIIATGWGVGKKSFGIIIAGIITTAIATRFGLRIIAGLGIAGAGIGAAGLDLLLGPIGLIALTGHSIAGPAYRVTIPSVVQIAYMRMKTDKN